MDVKTTQAGAQCSPLSVKVKRCVSVLPNDYTVLENLPAINGVTLIGNIKAKDVELLSSRGDDYETVSLLDNKESEGYLIVLGAEKVTKVKLSDVLSQAGGLSHGEGFKTVDVFNPDAPIGTYQFVEKKY